MQYVLMIVLSLHVLTAVFWAGSTFTLARTAGSGSERLFRPQMGAAAVVVLTGGYLWHAVHEGGVGPMERFLSAGALCALAAVAVQAIFVGTALRKSRNSENDKPALGSRIAVAQRVAAGLLIVATVCMAAARYA
ncbi:MAG: hypothetical protein V4488_02550 [Pseudomonadota bacterium]